MSAQRGLPLEPVDATSAEPLSYRATRGASRALVGDVVSSPAPSRRAARAIAAPVTFSVVRTRYTSPSDKKRQRRRLTRLVAPLGIAALFAGAALSGNGLSFAAGDDPAPSSVVVALDAASIDLSEVAPSAAGAVVPSVLGPGGSATVAPVAEAASDALSTDAAVKQAAAEAAAQKAAEDAAARQALEDAAAQKAAEEAAAQKAADEAAAKAAKKGSSGGSTKGTVSKGGVGSQGYAVGDSASLSYAPKVAHGEFIWPVKGKVSSKFGGRYHPIRGNWEIHDGQDLAIKCGTPIKASGDGTVNRAGWNGALGYYVQISHRDGLATGYGHMKATAVKAGQKVKQGDIIGYVGSTGNSTGCHVHFQALHNGYVFNPVNLVK